MLKLITNNEFSPLPHYNDTRQDMHDLLRTMKNSGFSKSQFARIKSAYYMQDTSLNNLKFRGLTAYQKSLFNDLVVLNNQFLRSFDNQCIIPSTELTIIHSESESLRFLRANMSNYKKRQSRIERHYNRKVR